MPARFILLLRFLLPSPIREALILMEMVAEIFSSGIKNYKYAMKNIFMTAHDHNSFIFS